MICNRYEILILYVQNFRIEFHFCSTINFDVNKYNYNGKFPNSNRTSSIYYQNFCL
eukprot:UN11273